MDDVWFAPGFTRQDLETFLAALALSGESRSPLLAVARGETESPELVVASRALFALFGAASDRALADRLLKGLDPGARRLASLCQNLPLQGAPRLERLRFFVGPGSEIITFLCRRIAMENDKPVFIAAALGVRHGLLVADSTATPTLQSVPAGPRAIQATDAGPSPEPTTAMTVQAIQTALRTRWPTSRTMRFLWQADADAVCTQIGAPLADVVGPANGDLVGLNLVELASTIDSSGRLADALRSRQTWSGLDVAWPVADAPAAVTIGLGAIPTQDRERGFEGYRGYGVIHLDRIVPHDPVRLRERPSTEPIPPIDNVVPFPGVAKTLSLEDQQAFDALRVELRDQAGLNDADLPPLAEDPSPAPEPAARQQATADADAPDARALEIGRNALAIFDRLGSGLLVSRNDVPIFANRTLLDLIGFEDEDALHKAGGLTTRFDHLPGGAKAMGLRRSDDTLVPVEARVQRIDWDGLPASLLTIERQSAAGSDEALSPSVPVAAEPSAPLATDDRDAAEIRELRAILETATDGVAVMDADCNVVSLNRSGEALFGCDRGSVIGKPFLALFAAEARDLAANYLEGLKSNATQSLLNDGREILIEAHRGGVIPVFMTLGRLDAAETGAAAEIADDARFCALFRDLTSWKKVERELDVARRDAERASERKSDILAKVSHELRTPLNAIIGFADVILDERFGPLGNARYKDYLRDIHASGTHVMSLVNDLLDLSKIEAGKMELAEQALDVNKVVKECVSLMQPQASRERVILRMSLAPILPQIKADERSLRQIILNLLSNAVTHNEAGGQAIVATAAADGGHVVIRIRDTGPGMSDDEIATALEPFGQVSPAASGGSEGTGLGLPLTKALVEANEATFAIKSKRGNGTLVEVAFPPARVLSS